MSDEDIVRIDALGEDSTASALLELLAADQRNLIDRRIPLEHQGFQAHGFASDGGRLYLLRSDHVLLVRNAVTGGPVASTRVSFDGYLMAAANNALLLADGSDVAAVDARSGRTLRRTDLGADTNRDRLLRLDARDGHVSGSLTLPQFGVASMARVGDDVWIVAPNEHLMIAR